MTNIFGIIGAGNIGKAVAKQLIKAGYQVVISNSRGIYSLTDTIKELGPLATAGTIEDSAKQDIVILALPWAALPTTLPALTGWNNRIVVDASNAFISFEPDWQVADLGNRASSEVVAEMVPGARLVKAFNTLDFKTLGKDPKETYGQRILFISGDDSDAKKDVGTAIKKMGFALIDLGTLAIGGKLQQAKGPIASHNMVLVKS